MMTYMTRALTSQPRGLMKEIKKFNIDNFCIDFITTPVLMVSFAVMLMVALIYVG